MDKLTDQTGGNANGTIQEETEFSETVLNTPTVSEMDDPGDKEKGEPARGGSPHGRRGF